MSNKVGFSTGLAIGSFDADDSFPTIDLSDGNGAAISHPNHARIRFNLSTQQLEQSINTGAWIAFATTGTAGSSLARYIIQIPDGSLPNAQALNALSTGLIKNTAGVLSTGIANTDFPATTAQYVVTTATAAPPNAQNLGVLTSGILRQSVSGGIATISIATAGIDFPKFSPNPGEFWVYLIDYDGTGNDTTGTPGISTTMSAALAAAIPLKTFERLGQILPRSGNGATVVILVKPRTAGATYRNIANSADADGTWLNSLSGWHFLARGSLDFANDTNDKIRSGFLTTSGTNTLGYTVITPIRTIFVIPTDNVASVPDPLQAGFFLSTWTLSNGTFGPTDVDTNLVMGGITNAGTRRILRVLSANQIITDGTVTNETFSSGSPTAAVQSSVWNFACQLFGGGAAALPSEGFSGITGLRIRFLATSTTTALQNFCVGIIKNTAGMIKPMAVMPALPTSTDPFVIESPGVVVGNLTFTAGFNRTFSLAGLAASTATSIVFQSTNCRLAGCSFGTSLVLQGGENYTGGTTYLDEVDATITLGFGVRVATSFTVATTQQLSISSSSWLGVSTFLTITGTVLGFGVGAGCVYMNSIIAGGTHGPGNATIGSFGILFQARLRCVGSNLGGGGAGISLAGAGARIFGVDFSNCGSGALIRLNRQVSGVGKYYVEDVVSPDGGNISPSPLVYPVGVLSITETKWSDGISVYVGTNAGSGTAGTVTATAEKDIIGDSGLNGHFIDLLRQNLAFMGIHIYGSNSPAGVWNNDQIHGPTAIVECGGEDQAQSFYGGGPFPAFRVYKAVGNLGANGPCQATLANASTEIACHSILGVSSNRMDTHGDAIALIQAGPCKIEFVAGQLTSFVPGSFTPFNTQWAYLSELGGANQGKARIGPPSTGVVVPLGPIHTVDFDSTPPLFAQVNLISHGRTYVPMEGHPSTSVTGNPLATFSGIQDIQATASGQFLHRDGTNNLVFSSITTADLPFSVQSQIDHGVANLTALAAVIVSGDSAATRFVRTVRDWYRLDKITSRTADNIEIVAGVTGFWVRENRTDPIWGTFPFVSVNPVSGNDENFGFATTMAAADLVPLKTLTELNRRFPEIGLSDDLTCHLLDTIPDDQEDFLVLTRLKVLSYDASFKIIGALTSAARPVLFTGTISGQTPANPATNIRRQITLTGAPGGLVGRMIQKSDGSKSAFILAQLSGSSYRISKPTTVNPLTGAIGSQTEFVNDESVLVYDLLTIPIHPFPASVFSRETASSTSNLILGNVRLRSADTAVGVEIDSGGSSSKLLNCILHEPIIFGGVNSTWGNVLFTTGTIGLGFMSGVNQLELNSCAFLNTQMLMYNCSLEFLSSFDIEGSSFQTGFCSLHMQRGTCSVAVTANEVGIFNCTQGLVLSFITTGQYVAVNGAKIYGSGNTSSPFYVPSPGCHWAFNAADHTAVTSAAHPISIQAVGYDIVDLPISLLFSQTAINTS